MRRFSHDNAQISNLAKFLNMCLYPTEFWSPKYFIVVAKTELMKFYDISKKYSESCGNEITLINFAGEFSNRRVKLLEIRIAS